MKLRYAPTSPFVRKVVVLAMETGQDEAIERIGTDPFSDDGDLGKTNPIGRIPALILDDDTILYDSPVICEYLDTLHEGPRLIPESGMERFDVLRRCALADGTMDAGVLHTVETIRRPKDLVWDWWRVRQRTAVSRCIETMEQEVSKLTTSGQINMADINTGAALEYIDFRIPDLHWRDEAPALADWLEGFRGRPSMVATRPPT